MYCLFAAGIVFGYAAIKPVLIDEGAFNELCTNEEIEKGVSPCYQQEIRLNLMFTVAAVSTNVAALPIGTILDRYGPRVCGIISSILLFAGAILMSVASSIHTADLYTPAYLLLALGGPFVFISSFQLSNTFPHRSGLILALLTGAFDSSSALFLLFRILYERTGGSLNTEKLFKIYLVVPVFILLVQVFVMPKVSYKSVSEIVKGAEEGVSALTPPEATIEEQQSFRERRDSTVSEITALLENPANAKRANREEVKNNTSGVWGILHGRSAWEQIKSPWFILITLFTVVQMTRINYYVATIRSQETWLLGPQKAVEVNNFFDVALPVGGVLSIPFIGVILDNTSTVFALSTLVVVATVIGVLGCLPYTWAAVGNIVLFVLYRPFYYTAVSDYSAKVFGFVTFGKVYGLIICLAGLLNFIQSPLDALTHVAFNLNPVPVNVILTGTAIVVGTALVVFVKVKTRNAARDQLEDEAEEATEQLMPNGTSHGYGT